MNIRIWWQHLLRIAQLSKVKITIAVSLTTITGYFLHTDNYSNRIWYAALGIFILACGSSSLNQIQEFKWDTLMERTKKRPLPSGKISLKEAWLIAVLQIASGGYILLHFVSFEALLLGLTALLWYNIIYTYLKRKTPYAVIPGSVIGAIPPLVGWVAGGGTLSDPRIVPLSFFFFIWQVPHFWLLMLKYGEEYDKAGFPSITKNHSTTYIRRITYLWIIGTAISAVMLPYFHVIHSDIATIGTIISSGALVIAFYKLILKDRTYKPGVYFMRINYYVLLMIILMLTDHLFI